jgi:hypothetical protein
MKHKLCLAMVFCILLALTPLKAFAESEQERVAQNYLKLLRSDKTIQSLQFLEGNRLDPSAAPVPVAHLFHLSGGGYLLIAASRSLTPVKAYSLSSDFDSLPPDYRNALLAEMEAQNRTSPLTDGRSALSDAALENAQRWDFLGNLDTARLPLAYTPDTWLIRTTWNQGYPYNKFTPKINGQATWAGCVNTALAQVMRYHRYPAASQGVVSYTWNEQPLKAILYKSYNWDNMPEVLDAATPEYQVDETARLIGDLGIANSTTFGLSGSGASIKTGALTENFGYSTAMQQMYNDNVPVFFDRLKMEIDAEQPVLISFTGNPGHMAVADGYASDENAGLKIHINMGWGGSYDNFYFLDHPIQTGSDSFTTQPGNLDIYYNIKPCSGNDCAVNLEPNDGMAGLTMTGWFDAAGDTDRYDVYLKGPTTIRGSRGYGNLAFYIYLYNQTDGSERASVTGSEAAKSDLPAGDLPAGKYTVSIGLCDSSVTSCYSPADGKNQYTVTITSGAPTDEEKAAIDASLDITPVINNTFTDMLLDSTNPSTSRILVDARDENGDAVTLQIINSNPGAFQSVLNKNILEITPVSGASKVAGRITVRATANGKSTEKSFVVMVSNEAVGFGKTFELKGLFENADDFNLHKAILDGACTITGYNGYSNQAFYSSLQDNSGNPIVGAGDTTISGDFTITKNPYRIGASLKQNPGAGGSYYDYQAGKNDRYTLTVNCPGADDRTETIAALLGIDLSGLVPVSYTLSVAKDGTGAGAVQSNPAGVACGQDCSETYNSGTLVTLNAIADAGSSFAGWSGCDAVNGNACTLTMNAATSVTATFVRLGDVSGDGAVTLADAILAIQIPAGVTPPPGAIQESYNPTWADVNNDGRIGLAEAIYILQWTAGLR